MHRRTGTYVTLFGLALLLFASAPASAQVCSDKFTNAQNGFSSERSFVMHVYWGTQYWNGTSGSAVASAHDNDWSLLLNQAQFLAPLAEYDTSSIYPLASTLTGSYILDPRVAGLNTATAAAPIQIPENTIQQELLWQIVNRQIDPYQLHPDGYTPFYVILLPPGVQSQLDVNRGFAAHHNSFRDASNNLYFYAVVENFGSDTNQLNWRQSHEFYEFVSDPIVGNTFIDQNGSEIGDPCNGATYSLFGVTVQKIFSASQCQCVGWNEVCPKKSCASVGATCGSVDDGCGGTMDCGSCAAGQTCGAGGPNVCGVCATLSCDGVCGTISDGCGHSMDCGGCASGLVCYQNACTTRACLPKKCNKGSYWNSDDCQCETGLPM